MNEKDKILTVRVSIVNILFALFWIVLVFMVTSYQPGGLGGYGALYFLFVNSSLLPIGFIGLILKKYLPLQLGLLFFCIFIDIYLLIMIYVRF